jgi:hypothetical protein
MAETEPTPPNPSPPTNDASQTKPVVGAEAPDKIDGKVDLDVDALWKEMNRSPFFMTQLPEDDGEENIMVEALKSMAYEGTRDQIAENFKNQGNEAVGEKRWLDAREFYSKALAALKGPKIPSHLEDGNPMIKVVELDDDETCEKKERALEEACLANRALCQLEMSILPPYSPGADAACTPPTSLTLILLRRELRLVQQRLRFYPQTQPSQRQSLVPRRIILPSTGQTPRSPRRR